MSEQREGDQELNSLERVAISGILEQMGHGDSGMLEIHLLSNGVVLGVAVNGALVEDDDESPNERARRDFEDFFRETRELVQLKDTDGNTFVKGNAEMFKGTTHCEYVHGFDTFVPVSVLAERVLQDGEVIDQISEIQWLKPLTNDVKISVFESGGKNPLNMNDREASYRGSFRTNQGREFDFVAVQTDKEINREMQPRTNFISPPLFDEFEHDGIYTKIFNSIYPEELASMGRHDTAYVSRSLMEMLTGMAMDVMSEVVPRESGNIGFRGLFCGIKDLDLPSDMSKVFCEGSMLEMRVPEGGRKSGKSGFEFLPIEYKFHFQDEWSSAKVAFKVE